MTTATSGVIARFPLLLPVRNSVASYGASAVARTSDRGRVAEVGNHRSGGVSIPGGSWLDFEVELQGSRASGVTFRTPPTGSTPTHLGSPPITNRSPLLCGYWVGWVREVGGGCRGVQGVPAVVTRGSRASGVTFRTPLTGSTPTHLGSPPITTDHHCFVGMWWVGEGGGWGGRGGHRGSPRW